MIKNIFRVLFANGLVAVVGLISSLLLPKILHIDDYATFQSFTLYLSYIAVLHLGFPTGMNIKYAGKSIETIDKSRYRAEVRLLLIILSFFTIVGCSIYLVTRQTMLLYISAMIFLYGFVGSFALLMQSWSKFKAYSLLHILMSAVPLALPIAFYAVFRWISAGLCIQSYILVFGITSLACMIYHGRIVAGVKSAKVFSRDNWDVEKLGFFFLLGNYINSLFHSIDKQFVKWFCETSEFSYYSFGLTMQSTMTIFITAVSHPLFPYMASGKIQGKEQYTRVKRWLLMLGSMSGLACFACSLVVKHWIPNYIDSIPVIRVYFAVFPAMAVISCLCFNLYKIRKMTKRYIIDLSVMLALAAIANFIAIKLGYGYIGVAFATTLLNYIWLVYETYVFKELRLNLREIFFIIAFLVEFFTVPLIKSVILGALVFVVCDLLLCFVCFSSEIDLLFHRVLIKLRMRRSVKG